MPRKNVQVRRVLVADRGASAHRVLRSVHEAGLEAVAIYSDADARSPHLDHADFAVPLHDEEGGSGFDPSTVISAAMDSGCDAVHPGTSRLAGEATFARSVLSAGLLWIGIDPHILEALQDRTFVRELASRAGLRLIPATGLASDDEADAFLAASGGPVVAKPAFGKGFVLLEPGNLQEALRLARATALSTGGDERFYVEKWLPNAVRVDIPVVGDAHGTSLVAGDVDRTLRWKGWELVDEAPCVFLTQALRAMLHRQALDVVRALGGGERSTEGLVSVSFLVARDARPFFLGIRPSLSGGLSVAEQVWGVDLVDAQLRIALGEPIAWQKSDLEPEGHAIGVRLLAVDAEGRFAQGRVETCRGLGRRASARIEPGVRSGCEVTWATGPCLARVSARSVTRQAAIVKVRSALHAVRVGGVPTNLEVLRDLLGNREFWDGTLPGEFSEVGG